MKDYKLSELKNICKKYYHDGEYECDSENCPIQELCFELANSYLYSLKIGDREDDLKSALLPKNPVL